MENARNINSIFEEVRDFFRSFASSESVNNGKVTLDDLSKDDKRELARVLKASNGNVKKIEAAMGMNKYKAKVDTEKAKRVAATKNKQKDVEDKIRDNK